MPNLYTYDGSGWVEISKNGTDGSNGINGDDGAEIELQNSGTHVQWRYVGGAWSNLIALSAISGTNGTNGIDGDEVELQKTLTHVQWRLGSGSWTNLVALTDITGPAGTNGAGLPVGGADNQILTKQSATDYDYAWETPVAGVTDHTLLSNIGTNTHAQIDTHLANTSNPHSVTKAQVGLGSVPNTDFTAAVAANTAKISYTDGAKVAGIEAGAQVNTVTSVAGKTGVISLVKADVGLGSVDNTSDASKPISTATQTALNGKAASSHTHVATTDLTATGTKSSATYLRGDNTWATPTNTTYSEISSAEITAGTASTARAISGRRSQEIVNKAATAATDGLIKLIAW